MTVDCRVGCGACCIAPSITSALPGMPEGKPAGVPCVQLTPDNRCRLYGLPMRPAFCVGLRPSAEMCGDSAAEAYARLSELERATRPEEGERIAPSPAGRLASDGDEVAAEGARHLPEGSAAVPAAQPVPPRRGRCR